MCGTGDVHLCLEQPCDGAGAPAGVAGVAEGHGSAQQSLAAARRTIELPDRCIQLQLHVPREIHTCCRVLHAKVVPCASVYCPTFNVVN